MSNGCAGKVPDDGGGGAFLLSCSVDEGSLRQILMEDFDVCTSATRRSFSASSDQECNSGAFHAFPGRGDRAHRPWHIGDPFASVCDHRGDNNLRLDIPGQRCCRTGRDLWRPNRTGFWWALLSGALATLAGLVLLIQPMSGALSLTLVMIAFFIVEGVATIMYAVEHRRELSGRWEWMLVSGVIDLVLAGVILMGFPGTAAWALGLLLGINMIFGGSALLAMALHARSGQQN
jgi:hypothetical protein